MNRFDEILAMCTTLELHGVDSSVMEAAARRIWFDERRAPRERHDDLDEIMWDAEADLRSAGVYVTRTRDGLVFELDVKA